MSKVDGGGLRFNKGKLDLSYCPTSTIVAVASVFASNSEENGGKYPRDNWRRGQKNSVVLASVLRHIYKYISGENIDPESGLPHLWHAQAGLAMSTEFEFTYPEADDRESEAKWEEMTKYFNKIMEDRKNGLV